MEKPLLFEGATTAKQYLTKLLQYYPYDVEEALVYSLLSKHPHAHPALSMFITYYKECTKLLLLSSAKFDLSSGLYTLMRNMSSMSNLDTTVEHIYNFAFQASIYITTYPLTYPYAHLALHNIAFIDHISLHETLLLSSVPYVYHPIHVSSYFIYRDISIDANDYIAISIQITDKHGIIFLSKDCLSLAIAICAMYHVVSPTPHPDFIILFGLSSNENILEYYYDQTNEIYLGIVKGSSALHHFRHLKDMISTLYTALCILQHDLPIYASMIQLYKDQHIYECLLVGNDEDERNGILQAMKHTCIAENIPYHIVFHHQGTLHNLDNEIRITQVEIGSFEKLITQQFYEVFSFSNSIYIKESYDVYQLRPCISFEESKQFHCLTHIVYIDTSSHSSAITTIDSIQDFKKLWIPTFDNALAIQLQEDFITMFFLKKITMYLLHVKCVRANKQAHYQRLSRSLLEKILR